MMPKFGLQCTESGWRPSSATFIEAPVQQGEARVSDDHHTIGVRLRRKRTWYPFLLHNKPNSTVHIFILGRPTLYWYQFRRSCWRRLETRWPNTIVMLYHLHGPSRLGLRSGQRCLTTIRPISALVQPWLYKLIDKFHPPTSAAHLNEEPLDGYIKGGYHPVLIGDTFQNSRYTVVRKLGWGQYATVWLARDELYVYQPQ